MLYAVARMEGASEHAAREIEIALGEALANARLHAYGGQIGPIGLDVIYDDGQLTLTVHDHGKPVTSAPTIPASLPARSAGGRGLFIIGQLMDQVEIMHPDRRGRGTAVRMVRRLH
jgi:anti-sigma regulatory factor (Ser/Thr protein kinase)